jgi:heptosyltransferase-2
MQTSTPEKVLIVQTAFIGDVILATALVESVKRKWPGVMIDFVSIPAAANILECNPAVRRVVSFYKRGKHRGIFRLWRFARTLRREHYDLALVPHRSLRSALLVWMAGIPQRAGFDRSAGRWFFTDIVAYRRVHEVERNLDLLKPFGGGMAYPPKIYWSEDDDKKVEAVLSARTRQLPPIVALAPGSIWFTKRWPQENFAELAKSVLDVTGGMVVLIGGTDDADLCRKISVAVGSRCYSVAGELTLRQTAALLNRCALLVSNDSAPTHMAVAARCRVITIFGSTTPEFGFAPYDPSRNRHAVLETRLSCRPCTDHGRRKCPLGTLECLHSITPGRVLAKINDMLLEPANA